MQLDQARHRTAQQVALPACHISGSRLTPLLSCKSSCLHFCNIECTTRLKLLIFSRLLPSTLPGHDCCSQQVDPSFFLELSGVLSRSRRLESSLRASTSRADPHSIAK